MVAGVFKMLLRQREGMGTVTCFMKTDPKGYVDPQEHFELLVKRYMALSQRPVLTEK